MSKQSSLWFAVGTVALGVLLAVAAVVYGLKLSDTDGQKLGSVATAAAALAGFIGLVVLVIYTRETFLLRKVAEEQNEGIKKSADAALLSARAVMNAERSWVLVTRIGNPEQWYAPDKPSYFPGMVFEFNVYGKTPARVINANCRLHPVPAKPGVEPPEPDLPPIAAYKSESRNPELPEEGRILPPEHPFQLRIGLDPPTLTEEQWLKLRDGDTLMCAYGFIEYKDAFENERKTRFCYVYHFAWGGVITSTDGTVLNPAGFRLGGPSGYHETT
jgi:hypothetical protein